MSCSGRLAFDHTGHVEADPAAIGRSQKIMQSAATGALSLFSTLPSRGQFARRRFGIVQ